MNVSAIIGNAINRPHSSLLAKASAGEIVSQWRQIYNSMWPAINTLSSMTIGPIVEGIRKP